MPDVAMKFGVIEVYKMKCKKATGRIIDVLIIRPVAFVLLKNH